MVTAVVEEKKRILERRMLSELRAYFAEHNAGLPMKVLACKYGKSARDCGGFPELIEFMQLRGVVAVSYSKSGARQVLAVPQIIPTLKQG